MIVSLGDSRGQQKDSFSQLCNYKGYSTFFSPRHLFFRNNFFPRQVFLGYLFQDKKLGQLFFGTKKFKALLFPESKTIFFPRIRDIQVYFVPETWTPFLTNISKLFSCSGFWDNIFKNSFLVLESGTRKDFPKKVSQIPGREKSFKKVLGKGVLVSWEKQKFVQGKSFGFRDKNLSREKVGFRDKNLSLILSRKNLSSKKSVLDELLVTFSLSVHSLNGGASYDTKIGFFGLYSISLSGS